MFTEFQTHFLKRKLMFVTHEHWFGVALGIPQNAEYLQKTLPKGIRPSGMSRIYLRLPDGSKRSPSILLALPFLGVNIQFVV